jgi:hypothetical protein
MSSEDFCKCGRILQPGWAQEIGTCDHCRELPVLERTQLAQREFNTRITRTQAEACSCDHCVEQWEKYS